MDILPEGEDLRKAVKWVWAEAASNPEKTRNQLIREACLKFDLSPIDEEYLLKAVSQPKS
ncbi:MAG: hypothetical protein AB1659_02245 [Thermodesulfobacteriota bacterium]